MNFSIAICLFVINFFLYFGCGFMIYKRRQYTCISIRSPILLYFNNLGGFLMTSCLILYLIVKSDDGDHIKAWGYVFSSFYFSQALMMVSFVLRCQRILSCTQIQTDERIDIKRFIDKRYLFQEKFYFKIFLGFFLGLLIVVVVANCFGPISLNILTYYLNQPEPTITNSYVWLFLNVIEQLILVTYAFLMSIHDVKQKVHLELTLFIIIWFVFSNSMLFFDYYNDPELDKLSEIAVFVALFCLYFCLGLNGFFPFVLSYRYNTSIAYTFNPKLMSNLYLFLTNETCYTAFSSFLKPNPQDYYHLKVYTHIMKYKLEFITEENQEAILNEAKEIYRLYFSEFNNQLDETVIENTKQACQQLGRGIFKNDMFDEALQASFLYLGKKFADFKNTEQFSSLSDSLALTSYIQCKMCNTGLINKF